MLRVDSPVFVCAGEPSGDLYAGLLINRLVKKYPRLIVYGIGGYHMRRAGAHIALGYEHLMTHGLSSAATAVVRNIVMYRTIKRLIMRYRPRTLIAVAYPGINLLLCRFAKKHSIRVVYYMPPQIWAWARCRKYLIKRWVDTVVSVFQFEADVYSRSKIETEFIQNPLIDELKQYRRKDFKARIGYMPGSRLSHIRRNMVVMQRIMAVLRKRIGEYEIVLILDSEKTRACVLPVKHSWPWPVKIVTSRQYQAMKDCDVLIVSSGTASLEAAFMKIPQIFVHSPSWIDYHILRRFVQLKEYNLTNLVYGDAGVPSCVSRNTEMLVDFVEKNIRNMLGSSNKVTEY
jgi:lipid-A-disaccharide synthase